MIEKLNEIESNLIGMREDIKLLIEKYSSFSELINSPEFKEAIRLEVEKQLKSIPKPVEPTTFQIIHKQDYSGRRPNTLTSDAQKVIDYGALRYDNHKGWGVPKIVEINGKNWAEHNFPKGSKEGKNGVDFGAYREGLGEEFYFSYTFMHQEGFNFKVSNKLPGFRMIPSIPAGQGLTPKDNGAVVYFNMDQQGRISWNVYHHQMTQPFGERMGSPEWFYTTTAGTPVRITMRIVLNTPGIANGILQAWVNGELKSTVSNVLLRTKTSQQEFTEEVHITCMDWDYPVEQDQKMYMTDFVTWKYSPEYLSENPNVARGLKAYSSEHKLIEP